ncbi:MAG: MFS transporter [SAR202 cluster bacterium]|nr:MFS transporter [SAR202 cluster bacterium]
MNLKDLPQQQKKIIRAWCMYDWANSAFATSGIAAIFPAYFVVLFQQSLGEETSFFGRELNATAMWSFGIAFSTMIVAFSSPVIGVIADRFAIKKTLLWIYTGVGSLATVLSFFSVYTGSPWAWLFAFFVLGNIGFAGSIVIYNSFLPNVSPTKILDEVSSRGFAYGYVGGGILLLVHLAVISVTSEMEIADLVTRLCIVSVGVWWFGWALWTLKIVPEPVVNRSVEPMRISRTISMAFGELRTTLGQVKRFKVLSLYLIAYLLFNDGIQTVMAIAGAFAADTLGIPLLWIMLTLLIIQFVAAFGSIGFAWLSRLLDTKKALTVSLFGWSFIVLFGVAIAPLAPQAHDEHDFQLEYDTEPSSPHAGNYRVTHVSEVNEESETLPWVEAFGNISEGQHFIAPEIVTLTSLATIDEDFRYTISVQGGPHDGTVIIGSGHPSILEKSPLDWWPALIRDSIWAPLSLQAHYQWVLLGVSVGLVMGGSQALARSLFAQMTPKRKSMEFFSFFGFAGRASSVVGPLMFAVIATMFDTRLAIGSILILIVVGAIMLRWVKVDEGVLVAEEENERIGQLSTDV